MALVVRRNSPLLCGLLTVCLSTSGCSMLGSKTAAPPVEVPSEVQVTLGDEHSELALAPPEIVPPVELVSQRATPDYYGVDSMATVPVVVGAAAQRLSTVYEVRRIPSIDTEDVHNVPANSEELATLPGDEHDEMLIAAVDESAPHAMTSESTESANPLRAGDLPQQRLSGPVTNNPLR